MAKNLRVSFSSWGMSVAAIACIGVIAGLQMPKLQQIRNSEDTLTPTQIKQELAAEEVRLQLWRRMPSFGFNNLLADWVFLQFSQYFGDDPARTQTGYGVSSQYFEVIIDRDPKFMGAYVSLATSISLYAAQPEKSIALMDKGLKSMTPEKPSHSYFIWRLKAIDQLLFLGDGVGAKNSFLTSAAWASAYTDPESQALAASSQQTAQFLAKNPQSKKAQVMAWTMVLGNVPDERTKKIARQRLESLGAKLVNNPDGSISILSPPSD